MMMMHKGKPVTTTLLPGDEPASPVPAVSDSQLMFANSLTATAARLRLRAVGLDPQLVRQAAERIAQPEPSAPTLVVAAFQSSI